MPSVEQNKQYWNEWDWTKEGDEWSEGYGTTAMQWHAAIFPRIHAYLPASTILEIAPGFGRWTQYLKEMCDRLIVVDLSEKCLNGCKERFKASTNIQYHLNDGRSLAMIPDHTIDFFFTFDSLVHVEKDVIGEYLNQLASKLTPQGVGFIHHSNIGVFAQYYVWADRFSRCWRRVSSLKLAALSDQMRARSMTADIFLSLVSGTGLKVISQELITWKTRRPIDCLSVITQPGSIWDREYQRLVNTDFDRAAAYIKRLSKLYGPAATTRTPGIRKAGGS